MKDDDEVVCKAHGVKTTWGALDPIQRLAVEEGIDTVPELPCLLTKNEGERLTISKVSSVVDLKEGEVAVLGDVTVSEV